MQTTTLLLIIGAAILALGIALFQYFFKTKFKTSRNKVYALLRFLSVFALLLLLINPKYKQVSYYTEKPALALAIDNSSSINHLEYNEQVSNALVRFRESEKINNTFDIQYFKFGGDIGALDSLDFTSKQTNISKALSYLNTIYKDEIAPTVLITDGNQTIGTQYTYTATNYKQQLFPVVAGDTITYDDIQLGQINVNRYAYINNKFPVEIFASYNGTNKVESRLLIRSGGRTVHSESVTFTPTANSKIFNILLNADAVGVRQFNVSLIPLSSEKNKANNTKNFAIEVIDQKTNVAIISDLKHPDIGALKKSIESNRLRKVTMLKPSEAFGKLNDYQLIVLYQPTRNFEAIFTELDRLRKNRMTITGSETDWNFLNGTQDVVKQELTGQLQEVQPVLNRNFSSFLIEDIGFDDFPPLETSFGGATINGASDVALYQRIGSVSTENPLLFTADNDGRRDLFLLGAGLWRWRAQTYLETKSFEQFDDFIDKLVQYAASNKKKSRLNVDFQSFYYGNSEVQLYAQYFDKNYVFDARAALTIRVTHVATKKEYEAPFLLQKNGYQVDLSNLESGEYSFTVTVADQGLARSGTFTIIPFEVEKQFLNANVTDLREAAASTEGQTYVVDQVESLINSLSDDPRYRPVQKSNQNIVPLIDWKWLLGVIVLLLAIEWFMRKYNGLT